MAANEAASRETVLLPTPRQGSDEVRTPAAEVLRFGPGVPSVAAGGVVVAGVAGAGALTTPDGPSSRRRTLRVLSAAVTGGIVAFVLWFLWPSGPLHIRAVSVRANPAVSCGKTTDVVATVATNGNPGTLRYRWDRGTAQSEVLRQSLGDGQRTVDLHLRWRFEGPGTYAAVATVRVLAPDSKSATVRFNYRCAG